MKMISAEAFLDAVLNASEPFYLLDVRTEAEYAQIKVADIISDNVPLDEVPDVIDIIVNHCKTMPTYVLCKAGKRAQFAANDLEEAGAENVFVIDGGTIALDQLGVAFKPGVISVVRQYHILLGSLCMLGAFLGIYVDVLFFTLTFIMSISALFHGLTGKCGILANIKKMSWNRSLYLDVSEEISKSVHRYQEKKSAS